MSKLKTFVVASFAALAVAGGAQAFTLSPDHQAMLIPVADGCGPHGWRGPGGHCHYAHYYYGPGAYGYFNPWPARYNGCPPGYWRGPWGHCRDTPYHGRLPGGGW